LKQKKKFRPRSRQGDGIGTTKRKSQPENPTCLAEEAKTRKTDLVEGNEPGKRTSHFLRCSKQFFIEINEFTNDHRSPSLISLKTKNWILTHFYSKKLKIKLESGKKTHPF
jgi:hypothetical protein